MTEKPLKSDVGGAPATLTAVTGDVTLGPTAEILWRLYADNREYARAHESQRSAAANLIIAIAAALLGVTTIDQRLSYTDLPLTSFLIVVGAFGAVFSSKHYERTRLHLNRAKQYLIKLDKLYPKAEILESQQHADGINKEAFPLLTPVRLNTLWSILYLLISVFGAALSAYIVQNAS
jgi:hypothetical protein